MTYVFLGIGARSATGISLPDVSLTDTKRGGGVWSPGSIRFPPARLFPISEPSLDSEVNELRCLCSSLSFRSRLRSLSNIADRSSSSSPASSSSATSSQSSPSAVSWSGGEIHSRGTMHGSANPMLAARLSHPGAGFAVSLSHSALVK